jgi:hypothetical protein
MQERVGHGCGMHVVTIHATNAMPHNVLKKWVSAGKFRIRSSFAS